MNASEIIKYIIKKSRTSQKDVAALIEMNKKTLDNKFYRDNFEANDLFKIADILGMKIVFIDKETENIIFDTSSATPIEN